MEDRFWEAPGCICPKLDNIDCHPHRTFISGDCPVHRPRIVKCIINAGQIYEIQPTLRMSDGIPVKFLEKKKT